VTDKKGDARICRLTSKLEVFLLHLQWLRYNCGGNFFQYTT